MTELRSTVGSIYTLIELLKTSGFRIDARIVREHPDTTVCVELSGEDAALFEQNDRELIEAVQHLASATLRLSPEDQDSISFHVDPLTSIGGRSCGGGHEVEMTPPPF